MKTISNLVNVVGGIIVVRNRYTLSLRFGTGKRTGIRNPDGSSGELAAKILASPGNALLYVYHPAGGIYSDPFIR